MPKRPCPSDDLSQPIKKQQNSKLKSRKIRSSSAERSLQLLYEGASKITDYNNTVVKGVCICSIAVTPDLSCNYCERSLCVNCTNICFKCRDGFCPNCSFFTYDQNGSVCYSCCS